MGSEECCEYCAFFYLGDCRRNPPQAFEREYGEVIGRWPEVRLGDWCAEFKKSPKIEQDRGL